MGLQTQHETLRMCGNRATSDLHIKCKTLKDFDELEGQIKALCHDNAGLKNRWDHLDFNGNDIVSLAEIDKWVVESYPLLNHKPALMRAYKKTIREGNGDDWVQKKEFKALLGSLFYFNKIFWIFNETDGDDRRMTMPEFRKCLSLFNVQMSAQDAQSEFRKIDKNGGGIILFDEFCQWMTMQSCPQAFRDAIQ